ncbi:PASTA domain-containing protein [Streptomyces sp. LE64]|uniref:PASTA domain-containing protein n=1 Tax=Streptomyces sp. LE64 TaxID=3448653 RepID=UPI004042018A
MHRRVVAVLLTVGLTALSGCGAAEEETAKLPDLTGKGLQYAQDEAREAGFRRLESHDALGRGRLQAMDRNWKVCGQTPKPGTHPTRTKVDFAAVKLAERCPGEDGAPPRTEDALPDFVGTSVRAARQSLDSSTSLSVKDATGEGRKVIVESNWKVCAQRPKAGTPFTGQPIALDAVKYGERC